MIRIRREHNIPVASMSDIAFLLIIFFLVSISFLYRRGLKLSLPKKEAPPVVISEKDVLILKLDNHGRLFQNNKKISLNELKMKGKKAAIINISRKCKYKYLVSVIEILQKNNITKISLNKI